MKAVLSNAVFTTYANNWTRADDFTVERCQVMLTQSREILERDARGKKVTLVVGMTMTSTTVGGLVVVLLFSFAYLLLRRRHRRLSACGSEAFHFERDDTTNDCWHDTCCTYRNKNRIATYDSPPQLIRHLRGIETWGGIALVGPNKRKPMAQETVEQDMTRARPMDPPVYQSKRPSCGKSSSDSTFEEELLSLKNAKKVNVGLFYDSVV